MSQNPIRAIGGRKYVVALDANSNTKSFKVVKQCQGILMRMSKIDDISLKIDHVAENGKVTSIIPDMPLSAYLSMAQRMSNISHVREAIDEDEKEWYQFLLPFSLDGTIVFDDNNYYEITLKDNNVGKDDVEAYFEYFQTGVKGYPIRISRELVKQYEDDKSFDLTGFDYCLLPTKFDFVNFQGVNGHTSHFSVELAEYLQQIADDRNDIELANDYLLFSTSQFTKFNLRHSSENDFYLYKVDLVTPELSQLAAAAKILANRDTTIKEVRNLTQFENIMTPTKMSSQEFTTSLLPTDKSSANNLRPVRMDMNG